ncbi:E3 ubiquitin-protein ligase RNF166 isoform X1 [Tursiops truncatus]|uniref:E3 ubiquitin-protein ligase RNF166 isoform X1 n=1 Tax=Tursiops truncatus TaxID=9739 RepID=UPI003CCF3895
MAMFRSLVASAQQRQPPGGPAGGDSGLEAQYSCPICLEVYHRPVAIGSCGHTTLAQKLLLMEGRAALRPTSALQVLRGVPPAVSAGAIPPVPTVPPALRPQESGQGRPRGEAAFVLQGTLPGLQQEGDTGQDESARCLLREGPGADGQLSQVRPCGAHVPAHPQCRPQQVHLRLPLLWCPQPGSAGVGEALRGQPPQRPQPRGVSHLLSHALGRPELQERQLPAAPAPPAQVLLRHLRASSLQAPDPVESTPPLPPPVPGPDGWMPRGSLASLLISSPVLESEEKGQLRFRVSSPHSPPSPQSLGAVASGQPDHPRSAVAAQRLGPRDRAGPKGGGEAGRGRAGPFEVTGPGPGGSLWEALASLAQLHSLSSRTTASTRRPPSRPPWPCLSPRTEGVATGPGLPPQGTRPASSCGPGLPGKAP